MATCPPPDYVKQTRTAAWLRLGKIAVFSVLAALSIAVGMAFPDAKNAEAQGITVRAGYTYTRMICQEWGQQPRWHYVRDPIPGSDWRNDGGWAIILVRGATFREERAIVFYGHSSQSGGYSDPGTALNNINQNVFQTDQRTFTGGYALKDLIIAHDGQQAFIGNFGSDVVIDLNRNGVFDTGDLTPWAGGPGLRGYTRASWRIDDVIVNYGASYTRWADMRYCR